MFPRSGFAEEGVKGIISSTDCLVAGHLAIWLDTMLQTVELPASVSDLNSGLADVNGDALTLDGQE